MNPIESLTSRKCFKTSASSALSHSSTCQRLPRVEDTILSTSSALKSSRLWCNINIRSRKTRNTPDCLHQADYIGALSGYAAAGPVDFGSQPKRFCWPYVRPIVSPQPSLLSPSPVVIGCGAAKSLFGQAVRGRGAIRTRQLIVLESGDVHDIAALLHLVPARSGIARGAHSGPVLSRFVPAVYISLDLGVGAVRANT